MRLDLDGKDCKRGLTGQHEVDDAFVIALGVPGPVVGVYSLSLFWLKGDCFDLIGDLRGLVFDLIFARFLVATVGDQFLGAQLVDGHKFQVVGAHDYKYKNIK